MPSNSPSAGRQIARAAGTVMLAFLLTQLLGLLRGILIYRAFGTQRRSWIRSMPPTG